MNLAPNAKLAGLPARSERNDRPRRSPPAPSSRPASRVVEPTVSGK